MRILLTKTEVKTLLGIWILAIILLKCFISILTNTNSRNKIVDFSDLMKWLWECRLTAHVNEM